MRINRNIVECKDLSTYIYSFAVPRINRNIVECKGYRLHLATSSVLRINRNIVECKDVPGWCRVQRKDVLIETLWNVKHDYWKERSGSATSINRNIVECKGIYR